MKNSSSSTAFKLSTEQEASVTALVKSGHAKDVIEMMNKSNSTWEGTDDFAAIVPVYERYVNAYIASNKQILYLSVSTFGLAVGLVVTGAAWVYKSRNQGRASQPRR